MSCQQVSRPITTTSASTKISTSLGNVFTSEDPYVFTDTVSAAPPILFNTQKARHRINEAEYKYKNNSKNQKQITHESFVGSETKTGAVSQSKELRNQNIFGGNSNSSEIIRTETTNINISKPEQTLINARAPLATTCCISSLKTVTSKTKAPIKTIASIRATNFKNVTQSQNKHKIQAATTAKSKESKKCGSNVCIVRPQQPPSLQENPLSIRPVAAASMPPQLTHTPSLWQTPLLLDMAPAAIAPTTLAKQQIPVTHAVAATTPPIIASPPTSPASICSSNTNSAGNLQNNIGAPASMAVIAPTSFDVPAQTLPIGQIMGDCQPLPPSKFHHTTLAQHLQKLECLKKQKKSPLLVQNSNIESPKNTVKLTQPPPLKVFGKCTLTKSLVSQQNLPHQEQQLQQHSKLIDEESVYDNDPNEIPVNVIFRKPISNEDTETKSLDCVERKTQNVKLIPNRKVTITPLVLPTEAVQKSLPPMSKHMPHNIIPTNSQLNQNQDFNSTHTFALNANTAKVLPQKLSPKIQQLITTPAFQGAALPAENIKSVYTPPLPQLPPISYNSNRHTSLNGRNTISVNTPLIQQTVKHTSNIHKDLNQVDKINIQNNAPAQKSVEAKVPSTKQASKKESCEPQTILKESVSVSGVGQNSNEKQDFRVFTEESELHRLLLPYCLQRCWLKIKNHKSVIQHGNQREERIAEHKNLLQRHALQLLTTHSLQKLPLSLARQRLKCVERLLLKYKQRQEEYDVNAKKCLFPACTNLTLTMASHCLQHIVNNTTQQIFSPCVAKLNDGLPCRSPVFDLFNDIILCSKHAQLRTIYEQQNKLLGMPLQPPRLVQKVLPELSKRHSGEFEHNTNPTKTVAKQIQSSIQAASNKQETNTRKRKFNATSCVSVKTVDRPQKRTKKQQQVIEKMPLLANDTLSQLPPISAVLKRKSSTTSLESIASNSQSSSSVHLLTNTKPSLNNSNLNELPALVPLSNHNQKPSTMHLFFNTGENNTKQYDNRATSVNHNNNFISNNYNKTHLINDDTGLGESNTLQHYTPLTSDINESCSGGFTKGNNNDGNKDKLDGFFTQDLFSICENSTYSTYASSEDTGLGGLSESELMGAQDADDIPLPDTRLLEEHDLANVLSNLPEDAFNELFDSVRQDECDEMDRQLELVDRHLRCLQESIGSDSDFLGDFFNANEDLLTEADGTDICDKIDIVSVINSPDTSGVDSTTMFLDSNCGASNSSNGGISLIANNTTHSTDIGGIVQT